MIVEINETDKLGAAAGAVFKAILIASRVFISIRM
jgi:hypothetical protein